MRSYIFDVMFFEEVRMELFTSSLLLVSEILLVI